MGALPSSTANCKLMSTLFVVELRDPLERPVGDVLRCSAFLDAGDIRTPRPGAYGERGSQSVPGRHRIVLLSRMVLVSWLGYHLGQNGW